MKIRNGFVSNSSSSSFVISFKGTMKNVIENMIPILEQADLYNKDNRRYDENLFILEKLFKRHYFDNLQSFKRTLYKKLQEEADSFEENERENSRYHQQWKLMDPKSYEYSKNYYNLIKIDIDKAVDHYCSTDEPIWEAEMYNALKNGDSAIMFELHHDGGWDVECNEEENEFQRQLHNIIPTDYSNGKNFHLKRVC